MSNDAPELTENITTAAAPGPHGEAIVDGYSWPTYVLSMFALIALITTLASAAGTAFAGAVVTVVFASIATITVVLSRSPR